VDNSEAIRSRFAGIRERPEAAAALSADGSEFARTELRRPIVAAPAFPGRDDPKTLGARHAGIRERLPPRTALTADRRELARAGLLCRRPEIRPALTAVYHSEAIGAGMAGVGECAHAVAAFATDRSVFHRAHLRTRRADGSGTGARFVDNDGAG
jgi:hypothetical protein